MKMSVLVAVLFVVAAPLVRGGYGAGDARKEKLYQTFIAPCCWQENLAEHHSPAAEQLRARIDGMVVEGRSDYEIKQTLIVEFGPRILALPEGAPRAWLFWTPFAVGIAGLGAVVMVLKRLRSHPNIPGLPPVDLPDSWRDEE
jgi:cytochrome c-type biogenesis protein CcmH/NrfF